MLLRLSRLSSWLAAAAGGLALFGPIAQRPLCIDMALALAGAAFVLWRAALALRGRLERRADAIPAALRLDAASLGDAEALVARRAAEAPGFEAALHDVADTLRGELGARAARVFLVCAADGSVALAELVAVRPGFRTPRRAAPADDSALGRALREQRPSTDLPRALALPVLNDGSVVAIVELLGIDMTIDEPGLAQLLVAAQQSLGARFAHAAARSPPPDTTRRTCLAARRGAFGAPAEPGGCAC
ncbi:MAG TPA: hypothetical protein VF308_06860 [Caldimonas sp.]